MRRMLTLALAAGACWLAARPLSAGDATGKTRVAPVVAMKARPFPLADVRLLDGPFKQAQELDHRYLLSLPVDRLLHNFRVNAGLPSTAEPLGGWEEPKCELRGHFVGHYLTACALMYASTGDARLKQNGDAVVKGLAECQARLGNGYLSAYPEEFIDRVEKQQRVWAPYYTLHKLYAGLLDMYVYCDNAEALQVCKRFADWVITRNEKLTDEQMQNMLGNEHGGMNEVLANLYGLTAEEKYLRIALRFNHRPVIDPAARREDRLTGLHANTQIPKFIGTARLHELTGRAEFSTASTFFWETVVRERSYIIGGHSDGEHFSAKETLSKAFGANTTETCNTYNMLKLTRHLFCWEPRGELADYYERALYNHILASQNPSDGMMCYYVPLRPGSRKVYGGPLDAFWCCSGTGIENHAKYGDSIYFHGDAGLWVNLFLASELRWPERKLTLRQETRFPDEAATRLTLACEQPVELAIHVRHPLWAVGGLTIRVNGVGQQTQGEPGRYATIRRTWQDGDKIDVEFPFSLRTEGFRDNPRRFAVLSGPIVLAAETKPDKGFPAVVSPKPDRIALEELRPVSGRPNIFKAPAGWARLPDEQDAEVVLEPFYQVHGGRTYTVYFDAVTPEAWAEAEAARAAERAREQELAGRTVDSVVPDAGPIEKAHAGQGERTAAGDFGDRRWRHATDGGWFSWELNVLPDQPQELMVTYWGSDGGNREFDVLIDGRRLTTQRLANNRPEKFYEEVYPIPPEWTQGKRRITIRFQARPDTWAGGVFGVRVAKTKP